MDAPKKPDFINATGYMTFVLQRISVNAKNLVRLFEASVVVVCGWALIEAPLELDGLINSAYFLAVVASKALMCLIGAAAIANLRFARQVFIFICGVGVFAIAPGLPLEYMHCFSIALISTVECFAKVACVALFVIASLTGDSGGENLSVLNRAADD